MHFTNEDWERVHRDWAAWWEGDLERPLVVMHGFQPPADLSIAKIPVRIR